MLVPVGKIRDHHQNALDKIKSYQAAKTDSALDDDDEASLFEGDDLEADVSEFTLGKKRKIKLSEIDEAGTLEQYKNDLKKDIDALDNLFANLERFQKKIKQEVTTNSRCLLKRYGQNRIQVSMITIRNLLFLRSIRILQGIFLTSSRQEGSTK